MLGIFDSGMGGLSVLKAIREQSPFVDIVYFGDTANMPYGNKDLVTLEKLTIEAMRLLRQEGATQIISACNSISSSVIRPMMELFGIDHQRLVEMVGPTVEALRAGEFGQLAFVGTPATIRSGMYQKAFVEVGLSVKMFFSAELASAIEFGESQEKMNRIIDQILDEVTATDCDTLVLGCTHYPLVKNLFDEQIAARGLSTKTFDPAHAVAVHALKHHSAFGTGIIKFILSKDSPNFSAYVAKLFDPRSFTIECLEKVYSPNVAA